MTAESLVIRVLVVEAVAIVITLVAVFVHALWYRRATARRERLRTAGRGPLLAALVTVDARTDLGALRTMPRRELVRLLADIAPSLIGPQRDAIGTLSDEVGLTRSATRSLHSPFWWRRLRGARLLTLVRRDPPEVEQLGRDRHGLVRAQRAEMLGQRPSPDGVRELVGMLGDDDGGVCFVAKDSLMRLGADAQPAVRDGLEEGRPELLPPLLEVAAAIPATSFLAAALRHSHAERPTVRARAAALLRAIGGGGGAVERLVALCADEDARVRAAAAAGIGALGHWPAAATVARLLDDADQDVRIAASVALQRLGAPGELLLRRTRDRGEGAGANIARQVLEMAERLRVTA